jgi:hypothetical protein
MEKRKIVSVAGCEDAVIRKIENIAEASEGDAVA